MSKEKNIVIRFLLNVATEEPAFVDIEFSDEKQVKRAMNRTHFKNSYPR